MKSKYLLPLGAALCSLFTAVNPLLAQGTGFTYQGRLTDSGNAYSGNVEFQATLWDAVSGGSQIAANSPAQIIVGVTNGLFILPLNFGANFPGANRWLQLEVRTTIGPFTTLTPRQPLTPAPYAITAGTVTGGVAAGQLTGTIPPAQLPANVALRGGGNAFTGNQTIAGSVVVDQSGVNNGTVFSPSLTFGTSSGEGIASRRTGPGGGNQYGLDFYTGSQDRMTILNSGNVGIGTTSPSAKLQVSHSGGVGVFSGDLSPFGTAEFESNLSVPTAHAWFAENGNRVFSVIAGGSGFFAGSVGIGTNNPQTALHVAGTVTATAFIGDGSQLTGLPATTTPPGMVLIPAGAFTMGDTLDGLGNAVPISTTVSAFYMDVNLVSLSQWQSVYFWATNHGYGFVNAGAGKAANHPVQRVNWYDTVKWCNARSEQAGKPPVYYTDAGLTQVYTNGQVTVYANWAAKGYRLPTEAEWEKAARGGLSGQRFPWGNVINQNLANYYGNTASYPYDLGPNGYNSIGSIGGTSPATSPVGSFAANGYGLNDMAGNVFEWCWDWYGTPYAGGSDPHGPAGPLSNRVLRGGLWDDDA